jgi:hypothetical protein
VLLTHRGQPGVDQAAERAKKILENLKEDSSCAG